MLGKIEYFWKLQHEIKTMSDSVHRIHLKHEQAKVGLKYTIFSDVSM